MVSALATEGVTLSGNTWLGISDEGTGSINLNINLNIEIRFHQKKPDWSQRRRLAGCILRRGNGRGVYSMEQ